MSGRSSSGKATSMTTPWTSSTRPVSVLPPSRPPSRSSRSSASRPSVLCSVLASTRSPSKALSAKALGPGDDLHDLLGDVRLALAVRLEREVVDQLGGVLGCVAHRRHPRAMLRCGRLQQRTVDGYLDVVGREPLEDLLRVGLVDPQRAAVSVLALVTPFPLVLFLPAEHIRLL